MRTFEKETRIKPVFVVARSWGKVRLAEDLIAATTGQSGAPRICVLTSETHMDRPSDVIGMVLDELSTTGSALSRESVKKRSNSWKQKTYRPNGR